MRIRRSVPRAPGLSSPIPTLALLLLLQVAPSGIVNAAEPDSVPGAAGTRLQEIADDFRAQLALSEPVFVTVVLRNDRLVSMQWHENRQQGFVLSAEAGMLEGLDDEELRAIVAHELGHAWIFTHHPYLQTERLANRIALQLVSRESLERVYQKVFERTGTKGDIGLFLGD